MVNYCHKPLTVNVLASIASDCYWEYDKDTKGGKTMVFIKPLSSVSLRKLLYAVDCAISNFKATAKGSHVFASHVSSTIYSRANGISCMKWWSGINSDPLVYNVHSLMQKKTTKLDLQDLSKQLLDINKGVLYEGDLVRVQVQPQINVQTIQDTGVKVFHLQFILRGPILRANPTTKNVPNPIFLDEDEDPLAFLSQ